MSIPQKTFFGYGTHKKLRPILARLSPKNIFLVTGKKSYALSGAENFLAELLRNRRVVHFNDFGENPTVGDVDRAVRTFLSAACDCVLGVGGGSALDVAKAVALLSTQKKGVTALTAGHLRPESRTIPCIAIPTTAGTGSEATHFCVLYHNKVKLSLEHPSLVPDYAILDPTFTLSLNPYITACTGVDTLAQGIESYWSVRSTEESRAYSRKAIALALAHIAKAVLAPDKKCRGQMLLASHWSGRAINIAKTTAAHAVSYPLTSHYRVPHGHAVALTLPHFLEYNHSVTAGNCQDPRGPNFVRSRMRELCEMLHTATAAGAKENLLGLMRRLDLATSLSKLGIDRDGIGTIAGGTDPDRMGNNPVLVTKSGVKKILRAAW